jgi:hypothetical protein
MREARTAGKIMSGVDGGHERRLNLKF